MLFESTDLRAWRYLGPLAVGDVTGQSGLGGPPGAKDWTGAVWECVDLFHLGSHGTGAPGTGGADGTDVLVFSAWQGDTFHPLCFTGTYRGRCVRAHRATPDRPGRTGLLRPAVLP